MKITDAEYLKRMLSSKKMELKEVETVHRIRIAEHIAKMKYLYDHIQSLEIQIDRSKE